MTTWKKEFEYCLEQTRDTFDKLDCTLTEDELNVEFDAGYGGTEGKPFAAYSEKYVYFPGCYDGSEWIAWVPRNPTGKAIEHIGGG